MSTRNTLLGIISGIAVGTIAGILFAPDKGEKTRKKIAVKAKEVKNELDDDLDALSEKATEKYEELKTSGKELIAKTKEEIIKVKKEISNNTDDLVSKSKEELREELSKLKKEIA